MFSFCSQEVKPACARGTPVFSALRKARSLRLWMSGKEPAETRALSAHQTGRTRRRKSGDDVGRDLVFDEGDAVAQLQLALLQSLQSQQIRRRRLMQRVDRRIEIAM